MSRFLRPLLAALVAGPLVAGPLVASAAGAAEGADAAGNSAVEAPPVAAAAALTVQVSGLSEVSGHLFLAFYDSADTWLGEETVLLRKVLIEDHRNGELVEVPVDLPAGEYAMTVFYDEDDNGELNTNFIGMPKEPVALSNNATGKFGPPKYEDAMFVLGAEPALQAISMEAL